MGRTGLDAAGIALAGEIIDSAESIIDSAMIPNRFRSDAIDSE